MASWPSHIPGPSKAFSITLGTGTVSRKTQSGRTDRRCWGSGFADTISSQVRVPNEHVSDFKEFFEVTLNMGVNWFTADWLPLFGYDNHVAKFGKFPKKKGVGPLYCDYSVTFFILPASQAPADTTWP